MNSAASSPHGGSGWQLILADLALILFLLTLSALPAAEAESGEPPADNTALAVLRPEVAPAQALFRAVPGGPSLGAWLAAQSPDPRATLTIFATYSKGGDAAAWARAQALADEARAGGTRVRTIITTGAAADVYASLAYDEKITDGADGAGL